MITISAYTFKRYKIRIYPTDEQKEWLKKQAEAFRYAYNWGLETQIKNHEDGKPYISKYSLFHLFSQHRNETEWLQETPLHTCRGALINLCNAYKQFFSKKAGFPKFKKKKGHTSTLQMGNDSCSFYFTGTKVKLPGLPRGEFMECKHHNIPIVDAYYGPTIIMDNYNYWLSVSVKTISSDNSLLKKKDELSGESIGIDVGLRKTAQLSNGKTYKLPDTKKLEKRKRRLMRRIKKSYKTHRKKHKDDEQMITKSAPTRNCEKLERLFYKTNQRIMNIKKSYIHNMTTEIANMYPSRIVMETLDQKSLQRWRRYNKAHDGIALYEIRRQVEYKCKDRGIEFVLADRNFPSSQICSNCGNRHKIGGSETYRCPCCGFIIDRDLNAAINLSRYHKG